MSSTMSSTDTEIAPVRLPTIDGGVRIGHVHLKVADLQRSLDFYVGVLGFTVTTTRPGAAFISAGGYHHHIGLNTWESKGGSPPPPGSTGLYHTAILYPTRPLLADALRRQWRRAILGPAERPVAFQAGRLVANVHPPARPARSAGGAG